MLRIKHLFKLTYKFIFFFLKKLIIFLWLIFVYLFRLTYPTYILYVDFELSGRFFRYIWYKIIKNYNRIFGLIFYRADHWVLWHIEDMWSGKFFLESFVMFFFQFSEALSYYTADFMNLWENHYYTVFPMPHNGAFDFNKADRYVINTCFWRSLKDIFRRSNIYHTEYNDTP